MLKLPHLCLQEFTPTALPAFPRSGVQDGDALPDVHLQQLSRAVLDDEQGSCAQPRAAATAATRRDRRAHLLSGECGASRQAPPCCLRLAFGVGGSVVGCASSSRRPWETREHLRHARRQCSGAVLGNSSHSRVRAPPALPPAQDAELTVLDVMQPGRTIFTCKPDDSVEQGQSRASRSAHPNGACVCVWETCPGVRRGQAQRCTLALLHCDPLRLLEPWPTLSKLQLLQPAAHTVPACPRPQRWSCWCTTASAACPSWTTTTWSSVSAAAHGCRCASAWAPGPRCDAP